MKKKVIRWIIFSVIIGITPIFLNFFSILFSKEIDFSFFLLVSKGESFLISAVIAAGAVGELIGRGQRWEIGKIISGGSCLLLLIFSSYLFSRISGLGPTELLDQMNSINTTSVTIFSCTFIASAFCVALAEI